MKHKKILAGVASLILLLSGISVVNSQPVKADNPVVRLDYNDSEDFNSVKGHDTEHPIWSVKHLGVVVMSDNPELQNAVKQACQNWAPAFQFNYHGEYIPGHKKSNANEDSRYIYVKIANLPNTSEERYYGETSAFRDIKNGYVRDSSETIEIDLEKIDNLNHNVLATVVTHELGHVIGLKHSTNPKDVMYRFTDWPKDIQPEEFALVRRLYGGENSTNSTSNTNNNEDNQTTSTSSSKPERTYKGYYFGNRTPLAVYNKILSHLFLIDDNNKIVGNSCTSYAYHTLYHDRHIGTKSQLHNGTYMGKIPLRITGIKPSSHLRSLSAVFTKDNGYDKGQIMPDSHIVSYHNHIKVDAHNRRSRLYTFYVLFRVRGHYFKLINEN